MLLISHCRELQDIGQLPTAYIYIKVEIKTLVNLDMSTALCLPHYL